MPLRLAFRKRKRTSRSPRLVADLGAEAVVGPVQSQAEAPALRQPLDTGKRGSPAGLGTRPGSVGELADRHRDSDPDDAAHLRAGLVSQRTPVTIRTMPVFTRPLISYPQLQEMRKAPSISTAAAF